MQQFRIGILFGGKSREREISFAGGRTVYDNLDKVLFEPVPIFIDSFGQFILLDWQYLYKGSIRDFYPPAGFTPATEHPFQVYAESLDQLTPEEAREMAAQVGRPLAPHELKNFIDFAFMALHGPYGEDGTLQGLLEYLQIPYSGSGILSSAIGINKAVQKRLMENTGFSTPDSFTINRHEWLQAQDKRPFFEKSKQQFGFPLVVKASSQGSSIGVSILDEADQETFEKAVDQAFFRKKIDLKAWKLLNEQKRLQQVVALADIQDGLGMPLQVEGKTISHPEKLLHELNRLSEKQDAVMVESLQTEPQVLIERFIKGKEFSCIVVQRENAEAVALPPTEIRKASQLFDYRAKYLPGISNKVTPIELPDAQIELIRRQCEELFRYLQFNVYARIDGILSEGGTIFLNDPNTTSGMLPSSFFFHQAAEIGLSPSQFLTYIIRTSIAERMRHGFQATELQQLLEQVDKAIAQATKAAGEQQRVGVILGGWSTERHISVESGRNVFEKLSSSGRYDAVPIFLSGDAENMRFHILPLNLLLKDNADDIRQKVEHFQQPEIIEKIISEAKDITDKYASPDYEFAPQELSLKELKQHLDFAFLALHGRPGEDGTLQQELERIGLPYNGSGPGSSQITIDKYETANRLREAGFSVAKSLYVTRTEWGSGGSTLAEKAERELGFPLIAKPSDDGCSSAVKKIDTPEELQAYARMMFRTQEALLPEEAKILNLLPKEEFPIKNYFLLEELIDRKGAKTFMEVTGGMLVKPGKDREFEIFEPSEALAGKGILSLEEKFLAGEGQNITPARYSRNAEENRTISQQVREQLRKAAEVLNIEGYCRIDAFVRVFDNNEVEVVFIEVNSLPGLTPATCIFHQAALNAYKPDEFLGKIIFYGIQKADAA